VKGSWNGAAKSASGSDGPIASFTAGDVIFSLTCISSSGLSSFASITVHATPPPPTMNVYEVRSIVNWVERTGETAKKVELKKYFIVNQ